VLAPFALLKIIEGKPQAGAVQPTCQIVVRRGWLAMQFPERFGGQFLRQANVSDYAVDDACQRGVVGGKKPIEVAGIFDFPGHRRSVQAGRHTFLTTADGKI
jgi:hypothetical protein